MPSACLGTPWLGSHPPVLAGSVIAAAALLPDKQPGTSVAYSNGEFFLMAPDLHGPQLDRPVKAQAGGVDVLHASHPSGSQAGWAHPSPGDEQEETCEVS